MNIAAVKNGRLPSFGGPFGWLKSDLGLDSTDKEAHSLWDTTYIVKVRSQNGQRARTDGVTIVADDQGLLRREVGNLTAVLQVLRITVRNGAHDLVLHSGAKVLHRTVRERRTLTRHEVSINATLRKQVTFHTCIPQRLSSSWDTEMQHD